MPTRPKLERGWSFPIKPSEVEDYFPGVGHVQWNQRATTLKDWPAPGVACLHVGWEPRATQPQPILTVQAIPSTYRMDVRKWIDETVRAESRAWMQALNSQSPTWLEHVHNMHWFWKPALNSN